MTYKNTGVRIPDWVILSGVRKPVSWMNLAYISCCSFHFPVVPFVSPQQVWRTGNSFIMRGSRIPGEQELCGTVTKPPGITGTLGC